MKNWIFKTFVAGKIAALFGGIKGHKTQIGLICVVALQAAKYLAPIPAIYLPYIDQIIQIIIGATGISLGDKIRRNYEIAKAAAEELANQLPVDPAK